MVSLRQALDARSHDIEKALAEAEARLAELDRERGEIHQLIREARAALGETPHRVDTPRKLHEAMKLVLEERGNEWTSARALADEVNRRRLYIKRDGTPVKLNQIHARAGNYKKWFKKSRAGIRLRTYAAKP